jgi:hypothetical protein
MPSKIQTYDEFALEKYFSSANSFASLADRIKRKLKGSAVFFVAVKRSRLVHDNVDRHTKEKRYQIEILVKNTEDDNNFRVFCETSKIDSYPGQKEREEEISYWAHQDNTYPKTWLEPSGNFSMLFTEGSPHLSLLRAFVILKLKKMGVFEDIIMRSDPQQRGKATGKQSGIV